MAEEAWLTFTEQVELTRQLYGTSIGYARKLVQDARKSGEVRSEPLTDPVYLVQDDGLAGLVGFDATPNAFDPSPVTDPRRGSKDDLVDWLCRTLGDTTPAAQKGRRYADDDELVAEAIDGLRDGTWPNPYQAAQSLASRAQGSSPAAKIDRLARKIGDSLNPETSRKPR